MTELELYIKKINKLCLQSFIALWAFLGIFAISLYAGHYVLASVFIICCNVPFFYIIRTTLGMKRLALELLNSKILHTKDKLDSSK